MKHNTPRQKKNCLQNFDLSEHRQIISDLSIHIYHQLISVMEKNINPAIGNSHCLLISLPVYQISSPKCPSSPSSHSVPGMLEYESLQGISSMKPTGFRKRSNSIYEDSETFTISSIIQQLTYFHSTMNQHGMSQSLINQAIKQMFFQVGATTINNLMLRKDMCSCRKGMQIRSELAFLV